MPVQIERLGAGDVEAFVRTGYRAFGEVPHAALLAREAAAIERDRAWWALDDGRPVGTTSLVSGRLRFPGGDVDAPVVTAVGVLRTHRRHGLLARLLAAALEDARQHDESWVGLFASEGGIYGRVGFGPASRWANVTAPRRRSAFRADSPTGASLRALAPTAAAPVLAELYTEARGAWLGMPSRTPDWFGFQLLADPDGEEPGSHPLEVLVAEVDGRPAGYAIARVEPRFDDAHLPDGTVHVSEIITIDPRAEATLWRTLLDSDLSERVSAPRLPLDPPLAHLLADPRPLAARAVDGLWLRPTDVDAGLKARGWHGSGTLVVRVVDRASRRWEAAGAPALALNATVEIHVEEGEATVTPSRAEPDLTLDAETLGMLALGDVRPWPLRAAGRLVEHRADATRRLDALLGSAPPPWCPEVY